MKIKNIKRKLGLLVTAIALIITLTLGGVFMQPNQQIISADASTSLSLFNEQGEMTRVQAQNILDALGDTPNVNTTIDRTSYFRLFPAVNYSSDYANKLAGLRWRITQVSGDRVTFWAYDGYRSSVFGSGLYPVSFIRDNLLFDSNYILARFPNLLDYILTKGTDANEAVPYDRFWVPSAQEVGNGEAWGLNTALRLFPQFDDNPFTWLRSWNSSGFSFISWNGSILDAGGSSTVAAVRPALHISLSAIQEAADTGAGGGVVPPPNNNNRGSAWRAISMSIGGVFIAAVLILIIVVIINLISKIKHRRSKF